MNVWTICASDPDAIGSLSCAASSFSSASRISVAGMFNMVFNTLTISGPPVGLQTWNAGSAASRPVWVRLRSPYSGSRRTALPPCAAGALGILRRCRGTRAMSAAPSIATLPGWAVAMTRDVALADTGIAEAQMRE